MPAEPPEQLSFDVVTSAPSRPVPARAHGHSLFFAVLPDPAAAARIERLASRVRARHGLSGRTIPPERLHVTLNAVGSYTDVPAGIVSAAEEAANDAKAAPFEVTFDRLLSFKGGRLLPLVLRCGHGAKELSALRGSLAVAMRDAGLPAGAASGFTPHMTLLYDRKSVPETILDEPIAWIVRELVLVHSLVGQSRHRHLGRWPLLG